MNIARKCVTYPALASSHFVSNGPKQQHWIVAHPKDETARSVSMSLDDDLASIELSGLPASEGLGDHSYAMSQVQQKHLRCQSTRHRLDRHRESE
jgi:hypothetical protein